MTVDNEKTELTELEEYADNLTGAAWKALARAQYDKSRLGGETHKKAMTDVFNIVIEVSNKTLRKIDNL